MGNSLQEQLLKAGLVDKSKANMAEKARRKQAKQQRSNGAQKQPQDQAAADKRAHDRSLNESRNQARKQREIAAQVKQIVQKHRQPRNSKEDETPYYFENKGKIKKMFVSAETHKQITSGRLTVVNCNGEFELVPKDIADRIAKLNPSLVIEQSNDEASSADDPYADFKVPDDLIW